MPEISIVVPIYNVEKYLRKCIESILNQTFTDFELILVNDGSTDKSFLICEEFKEKDERIKLFNKKNGGVSSARNFGIDVAKGKYISFIDPDDTIESTMYSLMYNAMIETNSDIVICSYNIIDLVNDKIESIKLPFKEKKTVYSDEIRLEVFPLLLSLKNGMGYGIYSPVNKLYNRNLFTDFKIRFDEKRNHGEDAKLNMLLLTKVRSITFLPIPLYNYFIRNRNSLTQVFREDMFSNNLENFELHLDLCKKFNCKQHLSVGIRNFLDLTLAHIIDISSSNLKFKKKKSLIFNITNNVTFQKYLKDYSCPNKFYQLLKILARLKFNLLLIGIVKLLIIKQKLNIFRKGLCYEN